MAIITADIMGTIIYMSIRMGGIYQFLKNPLM